MYSILTNREREVYELLIRNHSTREIARLLGISDKTVRNHISNVMLKLGVKGRAQAVVELLRLEELDLEQTLPDKGGGSYESGDSRADPCGGSGNTGGAF